QLDVEIRELKDLLDEKDEKIDILSRIHSRSPPKHPHASTSPIPTTESPEHAAGKGDTFKVQQSPMLLDDETHGSYFAGTSSGRAFVGRHLILIENPMTLVLIGPQAPSSKRLKKRAADSP